jgi:hypothetical protein
MNRTNWAAGPALDEAVDDVAHTVLEEGFE